MKDICSQEEEGFCPVRTRGEGRVLQMRMSTLFDAKNFTFFKICDVSARTREEV